jgi:Family of unknown function (DUF6459)
LPTTVTTIKAQIEIDELRERAQSRPYQRPRLPSPRPAATAIAIAVIEVRAGVRSPWHLERFSHYTLWPVWESFAQPALSDPAATAALPLAVFIQEPTRGLVNASITVRFAGRIEPVSLSLDGARGWWELVELECLADNPRPSPADLPILGGTTAREPPDFPSPRRPTARPSRIAPSLNQRWRHPDLATEPDAFDSLGIDLG